MVGRFTDAFEGRELSAREVLKALRSSDCPYSDAEIGTSIMAVNELKRTGQVSAFKLRSRGLWAIKTEKGWASIRVYRTDPSRKEYKWGLLRVRPTKINSQAGFQVYVILHEGSVVSYVFHEDDIGQISSLNLRFSELNRRSKYRFAKNRWDRLGTSSR
jgi:hypothetical protein